MLIRGYYDKPYLVSGYIRWNDFPPWCTQSKPYFDKLYRWLRKNWIRYERWYAGPQAIELANRPETIVRSFPPGVEIKRVAIEDMLAGRDDEDDPSAP